MSVYGTLHIVIGPPGAGKSTLIKAKFADITGSKNHDFFVDGSKRGVISRLNEGKDCVLADIALCKKDRQEWLSEHFRKSVPNLQIVYHCFKIQPERCEKNIHRRNRKGKNEELSKMRHLYRHYHIPEGAIMYDVWQDPGEGTGKLVREQ